SAEIAEVGPIADLPRGDGWTILGDDVLSSYLAAISALVDTCGPKELTTVYTPLHGVGGATVQKVMKLAGFPEPHVAVAQFEPDPEFPTVSFPNPEEPGAMDLAMALAGEVGADILVANDPDADRAAVAVPGPHGWQMLRGDEVGALLADFLLRTGTKGTYACSIVSSSLLGKMAAAHDQPYVETLTGFKWIGRLDGLVFGYEEALGYCVAPELVKDKDGISALVRIVELAALLKASGQTLTERLDEIATTYGLHATDQLSVRVTDLSVIADAMARLRSTPPTTLGGLSVDQVQDLSLGSATLPPTDGLRYRLAEGARVIVRPSGTEPKIKCYLEVVVPVTDSVDASRIAAAGRLDAIRADLAHAAGL
ncbi:MAG TPA: phospho-sugar mutase, partial [Nocardioidaceae bacterium]|nr:phospho-sugar mutase [Nocardioidaceae bacterium]